MRVIKEAVRAALARSPYRLVRRTRLNRFQAIDEALAGVRGRGFAPSLVVDGGANQGQFARAAGRIFPDAALHLIEPQPGCRPALAALRDTRPEAITVHEAALVAAAAPGDSVTMATNASATSTGAQVLTGAEIAAKATCVVPAATLDQLIPPHLGPDDRVFLKLDLQGFELEALKGGDALLARTDLIMLEVSFYAQAHEPPIAALLQFLDARGFELYDVASLFARPRDDRARQEDFLLVRKDSGLAADRDWA